MKNKDEIYIVNLCKNNKRECWYLLFPSDSNDYFYMSALAQPLNIKKNLGESSINYIKMMAKDHGLQIPITLIKEDKKENFIVQRLILRWLRDDSDLKYTHIRKIK